MGRIMNKLKVVLMIFLCLAFVSACAGQGISPIEGTGGQTADQDMEGDGQTLSSRTEGTQPDGQTGEPGGTDPAEQTEGAMGGETKQTEIYESVPYRLYPTSAGAWVGDVMPMAENDTFHLYYLYDTDHNGVGYHPIHKFSTENFYEYRDDGLMVDFGKSQEDADLAIGTGCVLVGQDGLYHCFYTGHNDTFPEKGLDKECVMHAVSTDNQNWTKLPEDTFYAPEQYSGDDFRDPNVFWNEEEQCYWLLIAARDEKLGGIVAKFTSTDLSEWTLSEPLYAPQAQYMLECPDLFRMGDWYYLFYSWDCVTYYAMSRSLDGPFETPEDNILDGSGAGFAFYAAKTAALKDKRYLCGWIGRKKEATDLGAYDWAGSLLVHQLVQKEDGTLGVREPESLRTYFDNEENCSVSGTQGTVEETEQGYALSAAKNEVSLVDFGMRRPTMMVEFDVTLSGEGYAGIAFGPAGDYGKFTGIVLDPGAQSIHYDGCLLSRIPYADMVNHTGFAFEAGRKYHVKAVMENEIVVLYVDDTKALSNRIYKSIDGADWGIYTNGADALFEEIHVYTP